MPLLSRIKGRYERKLVTFVESSLLQRPHSPWPVTQSDYQYTRSHLFKLIIVPSQWTLGSNHWCYEGAATYPAFVPTVNSVTAGTSCYLFSLNARVDERSRSGRRWPTQQLERWDEFKKGVTFFSNTQQHDCGDSNLGKSWISTREKWKKRKKMDKKLIAAVPRLP